MGRLRKRFERLYGDAADRCVERLGMMIGRYGVGLDVYPPQQPWNQADALLITYADSIRTPNEARYAR